MTILVTGAAGFIGSHLTQKLLEKNYKVIALDNFNDYYSPTQKRNNIAPFLDNKNFVLVEGDVRDNETLEKIFEEYKVEKIAHLAAMAGVRNSVDNPFDYVDVNINGTLNLLEVCKGKITNFIFISTSSVYGDSSPIPFMETENVGNSLSPYPVTKRAAELLLYTYHRLYDISVTILRLFSVYGPKGRPDMMPYKILQSAVDGSEITLYNGGVLERDWTYVSDIVSGIVSALESPLGYEIINLGRGKPVSMKKFIEVAEQVTSRKIMIKGTEAPLTEPMKTFASIEKAKELLHYDPQVDVEEGLKNMWQWLDQREEN